MTPSERITALLQHLGLNPKTFSELCGYDRPQIVYDLLKGKTQSISTALAARIEREVPDINRVWLLTGQGPMLTSDIDRQDSTDTSTLVPLIPISAIAGPLKAYVEDGVMLRDCQKVPSPVYGADFAMLITGDSMEPDFADGSIIYIRRINENAFIPWGHPLVLSTENGAFLKNVLPDDTDTSYIWGRSANPKYPPMHIPKSCVYAMFRVLSVTKTFTTM